MSTRIRIASTLSALTSLALLGGAFPAVAASAGACGDLKFDMRPDTLVMSVGQGRPLTITLTAERACTFDIGLRGLERDSGIEISPSLPVRLSTPASYTWRIIGTKPTRDTLVARLYGSDRTPFVLGVRLPDVEVHQADAHAS